MALLDISQQEICTSIKNSYYLEISKDYKKSFEKFWY